MDSNNENKNKYILREEVTIILKRIPEKYNEIKKIILMIYEQGYRFNDAINETHWKGSKRTVQRVLKKYSNNLISFRDLKRSYLFSNPQIYIERIKATNRKQITPALRWKVLARDNFRCIACGRSSKEMILHIDHKIPVSMGGENKVDNLRTLCGECNMGRGILMLDLEVKDKQNVHCYLNGCFIEEKILRRK